MLTHAILRRPGADFAAGITTAGLGAPDYGRILAQHAAYATALRALGLAVEVLEPLPGLPDAYFIEDVAVIVPELSVIARPGAASRRAELEPAVAAIARHREMVHLEAPATLDGGDVLVVDRVVLVGLSARTNAEGAAQLKRFLEPYGYRIRTVPVASGLHLKSSVSSLGDDRLLVTQPFANAAELSGYRRLVVGAGDEPACNTLLVNGTLLFPAGFPAARREVEETGLPLVELDVSEARKMDGGLSCMSLRL